MLILVLVASTGCGESGDSSNEMASQTQQAVSAPATPEQAAPGLLVRLLDDVAIEDVVIYGSEGIELNDRVVVESSWVRALVLDGGASHITIGVEGSVPRAVTEGVLRLRDRATVRDRARYGALELGHAASPSDDAAVFDGNFLDVQDIGGLPPATGTDVIVEPDQSRSLAPGAYGRVRVASRSALRLTEPGLYHFESLKLEPQSALEAPGSRVRTILDVVVLEDLRGEVRGGSSLLLRTPTSRQLSVGARFEGTLLALAATLSIESHASPFRGAIFGKRVVVHQDVRVEHASAFRDIVPPAVSATPSTQPPALTPASQETTLDFIEWYLASLPSVQPAARAAVRAAGEPLLPSLYEIVEGTTERVAVREVALEMIGLLQAESSLQFLSDRATVPIPDTIPRIVEGGVESSADTDAFRLQLAAVRALAYLNLPESRAIVLSLVSDAENRGVRFAAMEAYRHNYYRDLTELQRLEEAARPEERVFLATTPRYAFPQ